MALADAIAGLERDGKISKKVLHGQIAAISVGIVDGQALLDLDYSEDSRAETDMNLVKNDGGGFVEIQGTAEGHAFRSDELQTMLDYGAQGIEQLLVMQNEVLNQSN